MKRRLIGLAAIAVLLAGCSEATQDRTSGGGKSPDKTQDTWNVTVFKNADDTPNVVLFCINREAPLAILSTLSGGDSGKDKASQIVPMPGLNVVYCGAKSQ
jgi:hypothetical protein